MPLGKSHNDKFGHANPSATSEVIRVIIQDPESRGSYLISTWKDAAAKATGDEALETIETHLEGADFTTYFAKGALSGAGKDPIKNAEDHALTTARFSGATQT